MSTNTKTLTAIKTHKNLKREAQEGAETLGLSLGTLVNALLKQFVRTKEVTLSVSERPSASLIAAIAAGEKEFAEGNLPKPAKSVDELMKRLLA